MIFKKNDVFRYLRDKKIFRKYTILGMKTGLSNNNYIIESYGKKYLVRSNKNKANKLTNILKNEHYVLRFLEKRKIKFVPKSIFYDEKNNVHVLTYLDGRKCKFKNVSYSGMEQAVSKLHQINELAGEYTLFCREQKIKVFKPRCVIDDVRDQAIHLISQIKKDNIFFANKKWVLKSLEKDFENYKPNKKKIFLNHGDPSDNLILHNKNIYIIDWEYTKFTYGPGLSHILAYSRIDKKKEKKLLEYYAEISGFDLGELKYRTYYEKLMHYILKVSKVCYKAQTNKFFSKEDIRINRGNIEIMKNNYLKLKKTLTFFK